MPENILLATYNFYPYNWGGSEVYVGGLAQYLQTKGHTIKLIAAVPDQAFTKHGLYWSGATLRVCQYTYNGLEIFGVQHPLDTADIYQKYRPEWEKDWLDFFAYLEQAVHWKPALLHLHGFTAIIGLGLLRAFRQSFESAPIYASYHTPLSCPKGTLLRWEKNECFIQANVRDCSACSWQAKTGWSPLLAKMGTTLLSTKDQPSLPTALRWKALTKLAVQAFGELTRLVDQWWVFSEQVRNVLMKQGVTLEQITLGRHGTNEHFFSQNETERLSTPLVFAFIGRFKTIKGLQTLLKAWQGLEPSNKRQLWLIGDQTDASLEILKQFDKLKYRTDIVFKGKLSAQEVATLYEKIHILIVPSEWVEIGPLVIHEAIAANCNVIASCIGGNKELATIYAKSIKLFPPKDDQALKQVILQSSYKLNTYEVESSLVHYEKISQWYTSNPIFS